MAIVPKGKRLFLNAETKRTGSIRVAAQYGRRFASFIPERGFEDSNPVVGDHYRASVTWKNADDLGIALGEPVILHFKLEQAKIFALEFESAVSEKAAGVAVGQVQQGRHGTMRSHQAIR